jgi:E3 ubiquitin-protein ligase MARCH6
MVYGALVVICLGGVVWSLAFAFKGVLPIHWSSNEPVLEFPIDLLFYNFFMPLAVKFFKPSDGLHAMYSWWFRKCARMLRLTWFLFDERMVDEEGRFVGKGLLGSLWGTKKVTANPTKPEENMDRNAHFIQDGRYVRAPASDQVRIPKGGTVFLEVSENNDRIDGLQDQDDDLHGRNSELFKMVYVPPNFRLRIFLFILFIWIFAAVTGVSITIVPLVFGRHVFTKIIPAHVRKNDVYAFSIGIYILGSALYCVIHLRRGLDYLRKALAVDASTPAKVLRKVSSIGLRILRIFYAYAAFALVLPTLFALTMEFYFIVPLHTYFAVDEPHIIHFVQSWTLGLLYVKLTTRFILWHSGSRPAEALRAITRNGYLNPDIRIATRAFIFPATIVLLASLLIPLAIASLVNHYNVFGPDPAQQIKVYRYAYPICLSFMLNVTAIWLFLGVMKGWRMRIRDEVYLIGERLHNFGDRGKNSTASLIPTGTRFET